MSGWKTPPLGDTTQPLNPPGGAADEPLSLWVLCEGAGAGVYPLPPSGTVTIGRGPMSDVLVPAPTISRTHAAIDLGPPLRVRDLGSANGVSVRGRKLAPRESAVIAAGDVIEFGAVVAVVQRRSAHAPAGALTHSPQHGLTVPPPPPMPASGAGARPEVAVEGGEAIVHDPAMRRVFDLIARVGPSDLSVLVIGETGVGKELVAESVHRASARAAGPFVRLNCAALAPTLLESELFGHEKGSFTGAQGTKPGLLESADGGTVFLDEAGELPMPVQVKLLRVLEERVVQRVGALRPRPIDVRFVAATNRDLRAEIARGAFRQDLYYRLNGITVEVPALRTRPAEIEPLARHFAARVAARARRGTPVITPATLAVLRAYPWPGNVRELRNAVERAVLLAGDAPVEPMHLPDEIVAGAHAPSAAGAAYAPGMAGGEGAAGSSAAARLRGEVGAFERQRIIEALAECNGNQTQAAKVLGVSRRTLVTKLKLYDIPRR